jgi:outer membrane receptor protein involved in Fe transport
VNLPQPLSPHQPFSPRLRPNACTAAIIALLAAAQAVAQEAPTPPAPATQPVPTAPATESGAERESTAASAAKQQLDAVVITGTAQGRSKLTAPYAISTFNETQIERSAPMSTVDLLKRTPGFSVEASGGQGGGQNIYARGLPGGGWFYVQLQQNGLTLFDEPQESFFNIDTLYRLDMMTERVEVVRGGTSPIFANNAPGGTVNIIGRKGASQHEGALRGTLDSNGMKRFDGYVAGPASDRLTYAFGGFWRQGDGFRDPGYIGDRGGQLTAAGSLRLDDGRLDVEVKALNDRTAFYTGLPLNDPRDPSRSLAGQLDPGTGTLLSNDFRRFTLRSFDGTQAQRIERDLADGIHSDVKQINTTFDHGLGGGWRLTNRFGLVDAKVSYDAIFSGAAPADAATYLSSRLAAARTAFGPSVDRLGYFLANQRGAGASRVAFDPAATGGLVLESGLNSVDTELRTVTDDLRVNKVFDAGAIGKHDVSAGLYYSRFKYKQRRMPNVILTSLQNQPYALDVLALDAGGAVLGSVTENGFVRYGNGAVAGESDGYYASLYASDAWQITDRFTLDAGLRRTRFSEEGGRFNGGTVNQGDATTQADDNVGGLNGSFTAKEETLYGTSYTFGTSYKLSDLQTVFARYTRSVRFPRLQNVYLLQTNPVTKIKQAEAGWRTGGPFAFSAIAFYSEFNRLTLNGLVLNPTTGNFETLPLVGETRTIGLESELNWRASSLFSLNANLTLQRPRTRSLTNLATGRPAADTNDKQIASIPQVLVSVQPVLSFEAGAVPLELSATVSHVGKRYVDYANRTALPSYTTLDLGVLANITPSWDVQFLVRNATDSDGLTEGNPRTDLLAGQGTATAIYGRPIFGRSYQLTATWRW